MTYGSALHEAASRLAATSPTPRLDAELLLAHLLSVSRTRLLAEWDTPLTGEQQAWFVALVARRAVGEPVAYLVGTKEFWGRSFAVNPAVLVPRPETELLIEGVLRWATGHTVPLRIADIGTGSGIIAVTLALELPTAHLVAIDLSEAALGVAQANAETYGVADRIVFVHGDGFAPLDAPIDLIVSNPPYTILAEVEPQVRQWEPHQALDGHGPQGLDIIEKLLIAAPRYLRPGGALFMEIGAWQGAAVQALAHTAFPHTQKICIAQDLAGLDRLVVVET